MSLANISPKKLLHSSRAPRALISAALFLPLLVPRVASAQAGPGLGNIDCGEAEYFKPFTFLENGEGPKGANVSVMIRGYFMTIFAPDSGFPPGEIALYDLSDPKNPQEVDHIEGGDANEFREAHSLPVALIGGKQYIAIQTIYGIQFWDFTNPLAAERVGEIDLPGVNGGDYENVAWQTTWQGRYLYVSGGNQGIYIVDAADPTQPQLVDQISTAVTGGFRVGPLFALGDLMVISNMDQGGAYAVLDLTDPADPALLSKVDFLPRIYAIAVGGNDRIYAAGRDGNFLTHSFTDPTTIAPIKDADIGQDQLYAAAQDQYVFLGRQHNVVKVDVSDEQNPMVVGEGNLGRDNPDHGQVTPMGNLIFIGNDHGTGSALFCTQYGQDTTPLAVQSLYPKDGSVGISPNARINVLLSDYVDTETLSQDTVTIRPVGGEPLEGIYTYSFNTVSFGPDAPLTPDTTYEIVIPTSGLTDIMGNDLSEEVVAHFSTGEEVVIPPPIDDPMVGTGGATPGGGGSSGFGAESGGGFSASGGSSNPDTGSEKSSPDQKGGCAMQSTTGPSSAWSWLGAAFLGLLTFRRRRSRGA